MDNWLVGNPGYAANLDLSRGTRGEPSTEPRGRLNIREFPVGSHSKTSDVLQ